MSSAVEDELTIELRDEAMSTKILETLKDVEESIVIVGEAQTAPIGIHLSRS